MTTKQKQYACDKCKTVIPLPKPRKFCGCGGLLRDVEAVSMKDIEQFFPWLKKS